MNEELDCRPRLGSIMDWSAIDNEGTLYGRGDSLLELSNAYDRSQISDITEHTKVMPEREIVLISGPSGVGKTALAFSLQQRVARDSGFFVMGKFDQVAATNHMVSKSYGPFVEAMTEYIKQVIVRSNNNNSNNNNNNNDTATAETKSVAVSVREALVSSMSHSELQVLLETMPTLNQILRFRPKCQQQQQQQHQGQHQPQTRDIVLRGADAEERFIYIFGKFVQTISSQGYPLVLLLDDIQWINSDSQALLKGIIATMERHKKSGLQLMILCTCRSDDDNNDSLERIRDSLQKDDASGNDNSHDDEYVRITTISVSSLSVTEVYHLLMDIVGHDNDEHAIDLADIIYTRTRGNPFHIIQLLKVMEREGLQLELWREHLISLPSVDEQIMMNPTTSSSTTTTTTTTSAIQQLLDTRIQRLPDKVKDVLKVAACLGCVFSESCLVAGVFLAESEILAAVRSGESEGIVVSVDDKRTKFRFTHDKFQQATYMLIPDNGKDAFHLDVGLRLWHWLSLDAREEHLLLMGDQISRAIHLVTDKEERDDLANLFLQAGRKAAKASSFSAAAAYLKCGIRLLNPRRWKRQYKLSLTLYTTAAEIEYYCGNFSRVDELVAKVMRGAQSFEDTLVARFTRIYSLGSRCEMIHALNESIEVLKHLGEPLPQVRRVIGHVRVVMELWQCKWMLRHQDEQSLLDLPLLTDTKKIAAMRLMVIMHTFAFNRGNKHGPIIAARAVQMSLRYGISEVSCAGFAILALVFATRGDVEESYRCSRRAICIFHKFQSLEWQARLGATVFGCSYPLKHPLRESLEPLLDGHRSGLVFGDVHFSMLCAFYYCLIRFYAGHPLPQVLDAAKTYRKLCPQYGQHFIIPSFDLLIQLILNLMGMSDDPLVLISGGDDNNNNNNNNNNHGGGTGGGGGMVASWKTTNPVTYLLFLNFQHILAVYMNEYALAREMAQKIKLQKARMSPIALITHRFLEAVAICGSTTTTTTTTTSCTTTTSTMNDNDRGGGGSSGGSSRTYLWHHHQCRRRRRQQLRQGRVLLHQLKESAEHCLDNFAHKVHLVEAELLLQNEGSCDSSFEAAWWNYESSMAQAKQQGFLHEQALACERAAHFVMRRRRQEQQLQQQQSQQQQDEDENGTWNNDAATLLFAEASALYGQWGAQAKVNQLAKELEQHAGSSSREIIP